MGDAPHEAAEAGGLLPRHRVLPASPTWSSQADAEQLLALDAVDVGLAGARVARNRPISPGSRRMSPAGHSPTGSGSVSSNGRHRLHQPAPVGVVHLDPLAGGGGQDGTQRVGGACRPSSR